MIKEELNNNVMETTIEGAQKRATHAIESIETGRWMSAKPDLEYIAVFLETVGDEMAAISSAQNSMHDKYVKSLVAIDEWKDNFEAVDMAASRRLHEITELQREITELRRENDVLRRSSLSSIHAAHDNR
jgi:hypothetical protein